MPITHKISNENIALARKLYQEHVPVKEIIERCQMKWPTVYKYVKDLPKHGNQKHTIDHSYLDVIDTKEKAYFIGFFLADGYFNPKFNRIQLAVKYTDREILEAFKEWFSTSYPVFERHESSTYGKSHEARLYLLSNHFAYQLQVLGIPSAKTWELKQFPSIIDQDEYLFRYALKGFIDGDGWVAKPKSRSCISIIGTIAIMQYINRKTQEFYSIAWHEQPEIRPSQPMLTLKISGCKARLLERILYSDNIGLKRKAVTNI